MESLDTTSIDQTTTLGQVTMFVAVLGVLVSAASPFLPKKGGGSRKSRVEIINERLELESKNSKIMRKVNKDLSEWQLVARSLIRVLKNEIASNGGLIPPFAVKMEDQLAEIDEREVDFGDEQV